ncbi:glycosyltransferase family 2 protein [Musicola keenii]|uniref:glycosyltransferase family 2 protein n=1 Tax=Musicola keenii TaxID=2884250 RepID=UPI001785FAA4|nr:glycosyltransferase [Musicola keenii]
MQLGIVILNYFSHKKIESLLYSIYPQMFEGEIVIVDNSECKKEFLSLKNIVEKFKEINVSIVESPCNGGFSFGTNLGINNLSDKSTHVFILNPDTILKNDALNYLNRVINVFPDVIISPRGERMDDHKDWSFGGRLHYVRGRCDVDSQNKKFTICSEFGTCAAVIVPMAFLLEYGLLDEDFFLGGEEWELSIRMRRHGAVIITPSKKIYEHEISGTHKKYGLPFLYMGHRTKVLFMRKMFPNTFLLWMMIYMLVFPFIVINYLVKQKIFSIKSFVVIFKAVIKSSLKMKITKDEFFSLGNIK